MQLAQRYWSAPSKLVNGYLPKAEPVVEVTVTAERLKELGYVNTDEGWVHHSEAAWIPQNGKMVWVKM